MKRLFRFDMADLFFVSGVGTLWLTVGLRLAVAGVGLMLLYMAASVGLDG